MNVDGWKEADYDERFEMLYSSVVKQNSSWSQTAMALSRSIRVRVSSSRQSLSKSFQAPAVRRSSRSQRTKPSHVQSLCEQKGSWPSRSRPEHGRAGVGAGLRRGWRELTRASGGSDNASVVISDEGTDWEELEEDEDGRISISLTEAASSDTGSSVKEDRLWVLGDDGLQSREHVISLLDTEDKDVVEVVGIVGNKDDVSDSSSTASGPTLPAVAPVPPRCKRCAELFRKMRKLKHWKKSFNYDPTSLSCDQWVLNKIWRPRALSSIRGRLWAHLSRIRRRAQGCPGTAGAWTARASCCRPHVFLHRNLRRCRAWDAVSHRKPSQMKVKPGASQSTVRVGAGRGRKQRKRKLSEVGEEPRGEEPQGEGHQGEEPQAEQPQGDSQGSDSCSSEAGVLITAGDGSSGDTGTACRRLDFDGVCVAADPLGQSEGPQPQNGVQQDLRTYSRLRGSAGRGSEAGGGSEAPRPERPFPWVRSGGFRAMLAQLETSRNMVVHELDYLSASKHGRDV
ncbi:hypothetical protein MATL_G00184240 [Megalops atlanticus]|uniref:Uncharacterized protein n=1 Tax=Megalops atlanticus TaxID=7932 RepID=A0A9D3PMV7_MEGAT|nr:hypothetical protein MATL_G00184240 [Megalops atlanticus]